MFVEVRSEYDNGKLLFKWDPDNDVVNMVCKDKIYSVRLERKNPGRKYTIIEKKTKYHISKKNND